MVVVLVSLGDSTVVVAVHDVVVALAISTLALGRLIYVERRSRITNSMTLNGVTRTRRDTTGWNRSLFITRVQLDDLVLVVREVETEIPLEVVFVNCHCIERKLNTLVGKRTYVADYFVTEVGKCSHRNGVQQVIRLTEVVIDRTRNAVVQETEVNTCVVGSGPLPNKVGVKCIRTEGIVHDVTISIRYRVAKFIKFHV